MKKSLIISTFLLISYFIFSSQYNSENMRLGYDTGTIKSIEYKSMQNIKLIYAGTNLLSYAHLTIISELCFYYFLYTSDLTELFIIGSTLNLAGFLGTFVPSMFFLIIGIPNYIKRKSKVNNKILYPLLESRLKKYMSTALYSGITSSLGFTIVGAGALMIYGGLDRYPKDYSYSDFIFINLGITLAIIGGLTLVATLPLTFVSLGMIAWLKGELKRITPELSYIPAEVQRGGSVADAMKNGRISLALRVSF